MKTLRDVWPPSTVASRLTPEEVIVWNDLAGRVIDHGLIGPSWCCLTLTEPERQMLAALLSKLHGEGFQLSDVLDSPEERRIRRLLIQRQGGYVPPYTVVARLKKLPVNGHRYRALCGRCGLTELGLVSAGGARVPDVWERRRMAYFTWERETFGTDAPLGVWRIDAPPDSDGLLYQDDGSLKTARSESRRRLRSAPRALGDFGDLGPLIGHLPALPVVVSCPSCGTRNLVAPPELA